ncbi:uncharacterized protein LOC141852619 [Brevipalpus obovatus]|uniref:uncharacterized protein LOC141851972 n=1 Tax=Brevipalpus obovatus TaxID=246614 RepID=UPI003D9F5C2D
MENCKKCNQSLQGLNKKKQTRTYCIHNEAMKSFYENVLDCPVSLGDRICKNCRSLYDRYLRDSKLNPRSSEQPSSRANPSQQSFQPGPSPQSPQPSTSQQSHEASPSLQSPQPSLFRRPHLPRLSRQPPPAVDPCSSSQGNPSGSDTESVFGESSVAAVSGISTGRTGGSTDDSSDPSSPEEAASGNSDEDWDDGQPPGGPDSSPDEDDEDDNPLIGQRTKKTISAHERCIFRCPRVRTLTRVPKSKRVDAMVFNRTFIPEGARCCHSHLSEEWERIPVKEDSLTPSEYEQAVSLMLAYVTGNGRVKFPPIVSANDEKLKHLTSLNAADYLDLQSNLPKPLHRYLGPYLFYLRTGLPIRMVAFIFGLKKSTLCDNMRNIRTQLKSFVRRNLGLGCITRENAEQHLTQISRALFPAANEGALQSIWDATYIYTEKSQNNEFQRKTFSVQKKRSLYKPMVGILPDGYILDIIPSFPATSNDATILRSIAAHSRGFREFFREGDCFILDRGFRDVAQSLRDSGYKVYHPSFAQRNPNNPRGPVQLTAQQANDSRIVTKIRPPVEQVNGQIKEKFRIFDHVIDNKYISSSKKDLKIVAAMINKYHSRFNSDCGNEIRIIERMGNRSHIEDKLGKMVDNLNINLQTRNWEVYNPLNGQVDPFSYDDLYMLSCGTYGPKWINSYKTECRKKNLQSHVSIPFEETTNIHLLILSNTS